MALPGLDINIVGGGLGQVPSTADGVVGLILTGAAVAAAGQVTGIALNAPKQVFSLSEVETMGITATATDPLNQTAWRQIRDFYSAAGNGATLWFMLKAAAQTQTQVLDVATANGAKLLLDAAAGSIRVLGSSNAQLAAYAPTITGGVDADAGTAIPKAHALADTYRASQKPLRVIVDARSFSGTPSALTDLKTLSYNRVAALIAGNEVGQKHAAIGLLLGWISRLGVQQNIGFVALGAPVATGGTLTDGNSLDTYNDGQIGAIHDKGYIALRRHVSKGGYYFTDDPTATSQTDDFNSLALGRVIDKVHLLTYETYLDNLLGTVAINADGTLDVGTIKALQGKIKNTINLQMVQAGEISGVDVLIDHRQNVLATSKLIVQVAITPLGTLRRLVLNISLSNPAS